MTSRGLCKIEAFTDQKILQRGELSVDVLESSAWFSLRPSTGTSHGRLLAPATREICRSPRQLGPIGAHVAHLYLLPQIQVLLVEMCDLLAIIWALAQLRR